ncbi:TIR domain-containing protein [Salimicrobium album]|uniref:MTH538 TIR-like domain n=1 Tax=Salimicrobium album TaxID=50717 RepID=A0A1H3E719_9BACI|nr:TIR domain-containing protein [Salimicrobium album]SDX73689.1 MTH538 TIR-like domain [Salimicrobium album]
MVKRVFFSFHYSKDNSRAGVVRNSNITKDMKDYFDAAEWEKVKKQTPLAIKRWINSQLTNTSATIILIGAETSKRDWVKYEIEESLNRNKGILGINIHNIKNLDGYTSIKGANPLNKFNVRTNSRIEKASNVFPVYDWKIHDGYQNLGRWIDEACAISYKYL